MRKIRLDLDQLSVETFAPLAEAAGQRGTVHAHASLQQDGCTDYYGSCVFDTCGGPSCITCPGLQGCTGWMCTE